MRDKPSETYEPNSERKLIATMVSINECFIRWKAGKLNRGNTDEKKEKNASKSIGSNICKLHLVHVHLHWLASRPTFISFFLDQSAAPASRNIFEHTFSTSFHIFSFSKTECSSPSTRNSLALVAFLLRLYYSFLFHPSLFFFLFFELALLLPNPLSYNTTLLDAARNKNFLPIHLCTMKTRAKKFGIFV